MKGLVISNGTGSEQAYPNRDGVTFDVAETGPGFSPDLRAYDLLVVPNGADHVALFSIRAEIRAFLDRGKSLFCFCGWFLDWIPGNRWIHDNTYPTREVRHFGDSNPWGLLDGVDLARLDFNRHGISGWWACGYIEPATAAHVLIRDTWGRALVVADDTTTSGFLYLTASGPVGDYSRYEDAGPLGILYDNAIRHVVSRNERR